MNCICEHEICTGCHACINICPRNSISMEEDLKGFLYPKIDFNSCIDCGICKKICPAINKPEVYEPLNVYAAINKNQLDYETATSGGIATLLSREILKKGGIVYGAAVEQALSVSHIRVDFEKDVEKLKGSKYVQSKIGKVFINVKKDLAENKKVLFVGTPCQIAGLRKFLKIEYENLYTCDIICHGVPSEKMFKDHIKDICDLRSIDKVLFRDKNGYYLSVCSEGKRIYYKKNFYDRYCLGFLRGLLLRKSCTLCQYAQENRVGDITLGDFWGFDKSKGQFPVATRDGLSLVMVNTFKGQLLFEECAEQMIFIKRALNEAIEGNKQLRRPALGHKNYDKFEKLYVKKGFKMAVKRCLWKEQILYSIIDKIRK